MLPPGRRSRCELCPLCIFWCAPGSTTCPLPGFTKRDIHFPNLKTFSSSSVCCVLRIAYAAIVWLSRTDSCSRRGCALQSSGESQPAHSHRGFSLSSSWHFVVTSLTFSVVPPTFSASRPASHSFLCPEPSYVKMSDSSGPHQVVHAAVRRAVREHFQLELHANFSPELYRPQPSCCCTFCSVQLSLSAGEGFDVLRRAAVVDAVAPNCSKVTRRAPSGFGTSKIGVAVHHVHVRHVLDRHDPLDFAMRH